MSVNHESPRCGARAKPAHRHSHRVEAASDSNDLLSPPKLRKRRSRNSHPARAPRSIKLQMFHVKHIKSRTTIPSWPGHHRHETVSRETFDA
ncbi:hypothetical protein FYZ45_01180 [Mobiluncus mulieris]|nr:hypothetical protein [Mobiluncus mulieris]MCU9976309.1 hypothetical protein [Mobiluncus mulieris]MCU9995015.1 hypothetical protein [Mobiluncus mulieris]MCU9996147.1 hypothetical protein [Mobiluncus mulieris]MCV0008590.1 hypothetical protein [Mobiluncus mulieris]